MKSLPFISKIQEKQGCLDNETSVQSCSGSFAFQKPYPSEVQSAKCAACCLQDTANSVQLLRLLAMPANWRKRTNQRRNTLIIFATHLITFQGDDDVNKSGERLVRKNEKELA